MIDCEESRGIKFPGCRRGAVGKDWRQPGMAPLGNTAAPADDGNIEYGNIHLPMLLPSTPRTETATIGFASFLGLPKLPQLATFARASRCPSPDKIDLSLGRS